MMQKKRGIIKNVQKLPSGAPGASCWGSHTSVFPVITWLMCQEYPVIAKCQTLLLQNNLLPKIMSPPIIHFYKPSNLLLLQDTVLNYWNFQSTTVICLVNNRVPQLDLNWGHAQHFKTIILTKHPECFVYLSCRFLAKGLFSINACQQYKDEQHQLGTSGALVSLV